MVKSVLIKEIWLIDSSGIPLFHQAVKESINPTLFSGYISALTKFAEKTVETGTLNSIQMNQNLLTISIFKNSPLMIVALSDERVKKDKLTSYLEKIKNKIWDRYENEILNWNGCLDDFEDCGEILNIISDSENFFGFDLDKKTSNNVLGLL